MPNCLKSATPCLYMDDTKIFSSSCDFAELIANLDYDLNIHNWMGKNVCVLCMYVPSSEFRGSVISRFSGSQVSC